MATKIVTKNSSTASAVPTASDLVQGELAVNVADKRLFTEDNAGAIVELGTNPSTIDINAGTIDGTTIGASSASTGEFTTLTATGLTVDTNTLYVDSTNNRVGIGTSSPDTLLNIASESAPTLRIENTDTSLTTNQTIGDIDFYQTDPSGTGAGVVSKIRSINSSSFQGEAGLAFHTGTTGGLTERMRIDSSGNVGIGTTPATGVRLDIRNNSTTNIADLRNANSSGFGLYVAAGDTSSQYAFRAADYQNNALFSVMSDGNVGIGTSSPTAKLTVSGTGVGAAIDWTNTTASTGRSYRWVSLNNGTGFAIEDLTAGSERMRVDASGNVGIGTSSPSFKLDVAGNARANYFALRANESAPSESAFIYRPASGVLGFGTSTAERMRISSAGNVGIGTTPATGVRLDIRSNAAATIGDFRNASATGFGLYVAAGDTSSQYAFRAADYQNNLLFTVQGDGNVGIGTSSPSRKVHIDGGSTDAAIQFTNTNTGSTGNDGTYIGHAGTGTDFQLFNYETGYMRFGTAGSERMRIDSSGNLLVGTTTSAGSGKVTVDVGAISGTLMSFQNSQNLGGSITIVSGGGTSYNTSSDQRLKENIADADDAGSKVDAIQVRQYDWKADGSHQDYGMIAQELQTVAPEAVSGDADSEEMMGVDYSKLVPMLIKEIQSLRNRVAQLEE